MSTTIQSHDHTSEEQVTINTDKQNIANKKIYFTSDRTQIKIGYDDQTGVGFVEIIDNH